jgi:hypothetical protein
MAFYLPQTSDVERADADLTDAAQFDADLTEARVRELI